MYSKRSCRIRDLIVYEFRRHAEGSCLLIVGLRLLSYLHAVPIRPRLRAMLATTETTFPSADPLSRYFNPFVFLLTAVSNIEKT